MANKKISDLSAATSITGGDLLPLVDTNGTYTTKHATFQQVLDYVADTGFDEITASYVSGSTAQFTNLSGNLEWSYIQNTPTTTDNYGITDAVTIDDDQTISGRKTFNNHYVTASITGSDAKFTSLSGNLEWPYIQNTPTTIGNYGITDAVTISGDQEISGRKTFNTHYITASITGSDAKFTTISANSITANEYNVVTINRTTLSQEGSTKFGDDNLDTHQFSGSVFVSGNVSGSDAKFLTLTSSQILVGERLEIRNPKGTNYSIGKDAGVNPLSYFAYNIAFGEGTLNGISLAKRNVAMGSFTLFRNKVGYDNTAVGHSSLYDLHYEPDPWTLDDPYGYTNPNDISSVSYNTAVGSYSLYPLRSGSYNVAIGTHIGYDEDNFENNFLTGSYNILIGHLAGVGQSNLEKTVILRTDRDVMKIDSAGQLSASSFIGDGSSLTNLTASQFSNFASDVRNQFVAGGSAEFSSLTASQILVGENLLIRNPSATNYAIGRDALLDPLSPYAFNIAFGEGTQYNATTANSNVAMGSYALFRNKVGFSNTAIGHCSLLDLHYEPSPWGSEPYTNPQDRPNVSYNTAVGAYSLYPLRSGSYNVAIGTHVGEDEDNSQNSFLTGSYNILIGHRAGAGQSNLEKTVILRTDRDVMKIDSAGQLSASSFIGDEVSASSIIANTISSSYFYSKNFTERSYFDPIGNGMDNEEGFVFISSLSSSQDYHSAFTLAIHDMGDANKYFNIWDPLASGMFYSDGVFWIDKNSVYSNLPYKIGYSTQFDDVHVGNNANQFNVFARSETPHQPAVRIGTNVSNTSSLGFVATAISCRLGYAQGGGYILDQDDNFLEPIDIFKFYNDGSLHLSGTYAKIITSGSNNLELEPGGTGVVRFNNAYSFPSSDGSNGQVLVTNGTGQLSFSTISSGGGDVLSGSDNTFTAINTFNNHYITASAGITGTDANFSTITASAEIKVNAIKINGDLGNVVIGEGTHIPYASTGGVRNIAIGANALENNTTNSNVAIGAWALRSNTTGKGNVALGDSALVDNVASWENVAIGASALANLNGSNAETTQNTALGGGSLAGSITGSKNTAVGYRSLNSNVYGSHNVAIGHSAGSDTITGSNNIFIGYQAGVGETSLENTVIVRTDQDVMRIDDSGQLSASSFVGDGSSLTNLTASQFSDFTSDVRSQFTAGTNIEIVNGQISSTASGGGDVSSGSDNTFTGINTFDTNYVTASVGITGSDAKFTTLSGNLEWSYVVNKPTFLESNQTITLTGDATGSGTTNIAVSNITASYVEWTNVANKPTVATLDTEQTVDAKKIFIDNTNEFTGSFVGDGSKLTNIPNSALANSSIKINGSDIELGGTVSIAAGTGDVLSGSNNTFTAINTFNTHYVTASEGITGTDAKFASLSGNLNWSYIVNEPAFLTANQAITLDGDATGTGTTTISVSNITASYVEWVNVANKPALGTGDVLSSDNNTFTGINTFNTNYVTASVGITGSDAKFASLSGNLDWSYIVNEPTTLNDYGITDAVTTNTVQSISSAKSFTSQDNQFTGSLSTDTIKEIATGSGIVMSGSLEINGSLIADVEISPTITSTTYTIDSSHRGKTLLFSNSSIQGITCSSGLNVGFNCTFVQMGDGQLYITGSSGVTLLNRQAHSASAGRYAAVSLICVDSNQYLIAGDTM